MIGILQHRACVFACYDLFFEQVTTLSVMCHCFWFLFGFFYFCVLWMILLPSGYAVDIALGFGLSFFGLSGNAQLQKSSISNSISMSICRAALYAFLVKRFSIVIVLLFIVLVFVLIKVLLL
jgi:hypothetical protein